MARMNQQKAGVLLSYVNLILGCIIPIFYTPIMLDILGQAEYGLYSLSYSVTSYLNLLNLGLGTAIVRYLAKYRADGDVLGTRRLLGMFIAIYSCAAVLVCVVGGGMAFFSDELFAQGLTGDELVRLKILILIMMVTVATSLPISTFASLLTTYEQFVFAKVIAILGTVATPVANLVLLYLGNGSIGMAIFALVFQIFTGIIYVVYCARKLKIVPSFNKMPIYLLKELLSFSFFVFLSMIVDMLYWATDKVLIGAVLGTVAVAVYNVGGVFTTIMQNMAHAVSNVFTPRIMMMASKEGQSMEDISDVLVRVGRIQCYIVLFILSGYIVFGQRFIVFWAGEGYEPAFYIALLTMIPLAIPLIQSIAYSTITAQNKHRFRAIVYAVIAVVNVISTYIVLPYWGIVGAAVCTAVAFLIGNGIIMNIYYHRVIKLDIPSFWRSVCSIILLVVGLSAIAWLVVNMLVTSQSVWVILVGAAVYSVIFWCANWFICMNKYEKQLLLGLLGKKG